MVITVHFVIESLSICLCLYSNMEQWSSDYPAKTYMWDVFRCFPFLNLFFKVRFSWARVCLQLGALSSGLAVKALHPPKPSNTARVCVCVCVWLAFSVSKTTCFCTVLLAQAEQTCFLLNASVWTNRRQGPGRKATDKWCVTGLLVEEFHLKKIWHGNKESWDLLRMFFVFLYNWLILQEDWFASQVLVSLFSIRAAPKYVFFCWVANTAGLTTRCFALIWDVDRHDNREFEVILIFPCIMVEKTPMDFW